MLMYDQKIGLVRTSMGVSHTVVKSVLVSLEFWLFFGFHLFVWSAQDKIRAYMGDAMLTVELKWEFVKIISAMTTFFEVFYANQCYARYLGLYGKTRGTLSDLVHMSFYLRSFLGERSRPHARMCVRYCITGVVLSWFHVKGLSDEDDLAMLVRMNLVKGHEAEYLLTKSPSERTWSAFSWASMALKAGCQNAEVPPQLQKQLVDKILGIRDQQQEIVSTLLLPVPFQYFHLLSTMIIMNLGLWAYAMGMHGSMFAPFVFFCSSFMFIGMVELSSELSDPFGSDEVDFPLSTWLSEAMSSARQVMENDYPGGTEALSYWLEQEQALAPSCLEEIPLSHGKQVTRASELDQVTPRTAASARRAASAVAPQGGVHAGGAGPQSGSPVDASGYSPLTTMGFGTPKVQQKAHVRGLVASEAAERGGRASCF